VDDRALPNHMGPNAARILYRLGLGTSLDREAARDERWSGELHCEVASAAKVTARPSPRSPRRQ
jgi:hypothetical protein